MERFADRVAAARKYLPDFGVASYCDMGRVAPDELPGVFDDHLPAVKLT